MDSSKKPTKFLAISGNMGSGKTTLIEFLVTRFKMIPFFEPNLDNPYLEDFYQDMPRWAFQSQIYFLAQKFQLHQNLLQTRGIVLQDRTIYEDAEIFAKNLFQMKIMGKRDYLTYQSLYKSILNSLKPPDLLIYLRCGIKAVRQRIQLRGRNSEKEVPLEYLRRLNTLYERWFKAYKHSPTLIIQTDKMDYLSDLFHRKDFMQMIEKLIAA